MTAEAIDQTLAGSLTGTTASQYHPSGTANALPVVVAMSGPVTLARLGTMAVPASGGGSVPLSALGPFSYGTAPTEIQQTNREYAATVAADVSGTTAIGRADQAVHHVMRGLPLPVGYQFSKGGQSAQKAQAFGPLFEALLLSVLLVYMLMAALYESLRLPLSVMTAVPFAAAGALMALGLTGQTLNIFSIIGLIMLMGLVTKNAILLVDYTETLRKRGFSRRAVLVEAGQTPAPHSDDHRHHGVRHVSPGSGAWCWQCRAVVDGRGGDWRAHRQYSLDAVGRSGAVHCF